MEQRKNGSVRPRVTCPKCAAQDPFGAAQCFFCDTSLIALWQAIERNTGVQHLSDNITTIGTETINEDG
jgi:hypothetical protein